MILVVGSTGTLGTEICKRLRKRGDAVRALVRSSSDPAKVKVLEDLGCEIATGDLQDRESLERACEGAEAVVTTANTVLSRQGHDSFEKTDLEGHKALIEFAEKHDVKRFVLISISANMDVDSGLLRAKREVEDKLLESGVAYTIIRPGFFMEVWLSPMLGFDASNGAARIYGSGKQPLSYVSLFDVAEVAVQAIDGESVANRTIDMGGPEAIAPNDVVKIFEEELGRKIEVSYVPPEALAQQYENAPDDYQKNFAAFMLAIDKGDDIDMNDTLRRLPMKLKSVRDYARALARRT